MKKVTGNGEEKSIAGDEMKRKENVMHTLN
jgi:hypothetical protein